jgi:hypothetical protein
MFVLLNKYLVIFRPISMKIHEIIIHHVLESFDIVLRELFLLLTGWMKSCVNEYLLRDVMIMWPLKMKERK